MVKGDPDPARRALFWKWGKGTAGLSQADFGDPVNGSTNYSLCIYDQTGGSSALKLSVPMLPGGTCFNRPCWKTSGSRGWKYKDFLAGIRMSLKGGAAGTPRLKFKQRKPVVPAPGSGTQFFDQDPAVIVQLHASSPPNCWSSTFDQSSAQRNDGTRFKAASH